MGMDGREERGWGSELMQQNVWTRRILITHTINKIVLRLHCTVQKF